MCSDGVTVLDRGRESRRYDRPTDGGVSGTPLKRVRIDAMLIRVSYKNEVFVRINIAMNMVV